MLTSYPEVQVRENLVSVIRKFQPNVVMTWYGYPTFSLLPSAGWGDLGTETSCVLILRNGRGGGEG